MGGTEWFVGRNEVHLDYRPPPMGGNVISDQFQSPSDIRLAVIAFDQSYFGHPLSSFLLLLPTKRQK